MPQLTNNTTVGIGAAGAIVALSAAQLSLPENCLVLIPEGGPGKYVGAITRGEMGYCPTTYDCQTEEAAKRLIAQVHSNIGVTDLQATCMHHGSMFGWHTPGADPDKFSKIMSERAYRADARIPI